MKEAPTDTSPSTQNTSPSRSSPTARPIWKRALLLVVGAPVVLLLYVILQSLFTSSEEPEIAAGGRVRAIQLDVLNGSGEAKLAQRMTDFLRARGFDVVEMGNYPSSDVEATVVLDRVGNLAAAKQVAAALGIADERVQQQVDKSLYLDVSVIIGKDYQRLKAFQ